MWMKIITIMVSLYKLCEEKLYDFDLGLQRKR